MAHFAQLNQDNIVTQVIVVNNDILPVDLVEQGNVGIRFLQDLLGYDTTWVQTSYNNNFRGIYASVGYTYDSVNDVFIPPSLSDNE